MVDFALVGGLLTILFVAVLQLTLVLHVRNVLIDSAARGAGAGARAGAGPGDAEERARQLIEADLGPAYARRILARTTVIDGLATVEVQVVAPLPVAGLLGPSGALTVIGHAPLEPEP